MASPGGIGLVIANPVAISRILPGGSSDSTERFVYPRGKLNRSKSSPVRFGFLRSGIQTRSPVLLRLMTESTPA